MGRSGRRWSIPVELLVPTALSTVLGAVLILLSSDATRLVGFMPLDAARYALVLCGLLELRRRWRDPRARLIGFCAALMALRLAVLVAERLLYPGISPETWYAWIELRFDLLCVHGLAYMVLVVTAARAWRSPLGPLAVVAALWQAPPTPLMDWLVDRFSPQSSWLWFFLPSMLLHAATLLALYHRIGAGLAPEPDYLRAVRGAARSAWWLRRRIAVTVVITMLALAVTISGPNLVWTIALLACSVAMIVCIGGTLAGWIGMARAEIPGLSSTAMCVAAFGMLWGDLLQYSRGTQLAAAARVSTEAHVVMAIAVLTSALLVVACAGAIRALAAQRNDRLLRHAVSTRVAWYLVFALMTVVGMLDTSPATPGGMVAFSLFMLVAQGGAMWALASLFARTSERLKLASAVDAF